MASGVISTHPPYHEATQNYYSHNKLLQLPIIWGALCCRPPYPTTAVTLKLLFSTLAIGVSVLVRFFPQRGPAAAFKAEAGLLPPTPA